MDKNFLISKLADAIDQSKGDFGRNQYLLNRIKQNKEFINSDKIYLERILELEILEIIEATNNQNQKIPFKDKSVFLNPNLIKCATCNNEIKLDEKSTMVYLHSDEDTIRLTNKNMRTFRGAALKVV